MVQRTGNNQPFNKSGKQDAERRSNEGIAFASGLSITQMVSLVVEKSELPEIRIVPLDIRLQFLAEL